MYAEVVKKPIVSKQSNPLKELDQNGRPNARNGKKNLGYGPEAYAKVIRKPKGGDFCISYSEQHEASSNAMSQDCNQRPSKDKRSEHGQSKRDSKGDFSNMFFSEFFSHMFLLNLILFVCFDIESKVVPFSQHKFQIGSSITSIAYPSALKQVKAYTYTRHYCSYN